MYEIPHSTPPKLKDEKKWSKKFQDFIADTLIKSPTDRPAAAQLLKVFCSFFFLFSQNSNRQ